MLTKYSIKKGIHSRNIKSYYKARNNNSKLKPNIEQYNQKYFKEVTKKNPYEMPFVENVHIL